MNEQIKELAEQAGCVQHEFIWVANNFDMERFAELVRQDEREACAKLCEDEYKLRLAETIRARGNT
jgi:hypothetical protein